MLFTGAPSPVAAELRYTTHAEARRLPGVPADPLTGAFGAMLTDLLPKLRMTTIVGEAGVRVEVEADVGPLPSGSVVLLKEGSAFVLNPRDQTFWTIPASTGAALASLNPQASSMRTGEFETVAGLRAERVTYTLMLTLPLPPGVQLPLGFPQTFTLDGEMWVADQFKAYAEALAATPLAATGLNAGAFGGLASEGLIVRQIARSDFFGYEFEFIVSDVTEVPVSPDLFEVPAEFREVAPPTLAPPQ